MYDFCHFIFSLRHLHLKKIFKHHKMHKIDIHPILEIKKGEKVTFLYEGKKIESEK